MPLCIIPDRSEAPKQDVQSSSAKGDDVFAEDIGRLEFVDKSKLLEPQAGSLAADTDRSAVGVADVLTREPSGDDVGSLGKVGSFQIADVGEMLRGGPVAFQHRLRVRVVVAQGDRRHPGALHPERRTADSREKVQAGETRHRWSHTTSGVPCRPGSQPGCASARSKGWRSTIPTPRASACEDKRPS